MPATSAERPALLLGEHGTVTGTPPYQDKCQFVAASETAEIQMLIASEDQLIEESGIMYVLPVTVETVLSSFNL